MCALSASGLPSLLRDLARAAPWRGRRRRDRRAAPFRAGRFRHASAAPSCRAVRRAPGRNICGDRGRTLDRPGFGARSLDSVRLRRAAAATGRAGSVISSLRPRSSRFSARVGSRSCLSSIRRTGRTTVSSNPDDVSRRARSAARDRGSRRGRRDWRAGSGRARGSRSRCTR